jgi:hypothetical protein
MRDAKRCEIHEEASDESYRVTEPCGRPATWWSDDVSEGSTVWMCERHCLETMRRVDGEAHPSEPETLPAPAEVSP